MLFHPDGTAETSFGFLARVGLALAGDCRKGWCEGPKAVARAISRVSRPKRSQRRKVISIALGLNEVRGAKVVAVRVIGL